MRECAPGEEERRGDQAHGNLDLDGFPARPTPGRSEAGRPLRAAPRWEEGLGLHSYHPPPPHPSVTGCSLVLGGGGAGVEEVSFSLRQSPKRVDGKSL